MLIFWKHLAEHLTAELKRLLPDCTVVITAEMLMKAAKVPSVPAAIRWEQMQKVAEWLSTPRNLITDPFLVDLFNQAGIDISLIAMLKLGLHIIYMNQYHRWFAK